MQEARQILRARARLLLRSERALGVDALPVNLLPQTNRAPAPIEPATDRTATGSTPSLFGIPEESEAVALQAALVAPVLSTDEKHRRLLELDIHEVHGCTKCRLCESRTQTVFGEGDPDAKIFFIGEGPGETEDQTGRPFVGRAGALLDRMIAAMGLKREQVYIGNIVKCRPPGNREPAPDEVATCTQYLQRQIEIIRPAVIVTLGRPALEHMLGRKISITRMRGQWQSWRGIKLMPTYHPAYILRQYTPEIRAAVWSDLQLVMSELGLAPPLRARQQEV